MPRTSRRATVASTDPSGNRPLVVQPEVNGTPVNGHTDIDPGRGPRSSSPLSPTCETLKGERREMKSLNNRLASYIDRVRSQELEIESLTHELTLISEARDSERSNFRAAFEEEMTHLRTTLDVVSKERAQAQIEAEKYLKDASDSKARLTKLEATHKRVADECHRLRSEVDNIRQKFKAAEAELHDLRPLVEEQKIKLDERQISLEEETMKRIELTNQLQTTREQMQFENQLLERHLNDSVAKRQVEISDLDSQLRQQYDDSLQQSLSEFRLAYEDQMANSRAEFVAQFEAKLAALQGKLDMANRVCADKKANLDELAAAKLQLERANAHLQDRLKTVSSDMEKLSRQHKSESARKDAELSSKEEQISEMMKDYRELMESKLGRDMEIAAYRKLIEGEEARLGLSVDQNSDGDETVSRSYKRRRTAYGSPSFDYRDEVDGASPAIGRSGSVVNVVTSHAKSADEDGNEPLLEIEAIEHRGKCIRIHNLHPSIDNSSEDGGEDDENAISIGGYTLANVTGGEVTSYRFHRSTKIPPGKTCTIWSADSGQKHNPPLNLVLKSGNWDFGNDNVTTLSDKSGAELAKRLTRFEKMIVPRANRHLTSPGKSSRLLSKPGEHDKSCAVM